MVVNMIFMQLIRMRKNIILKLSHPVIQVLEMTYQEHKENTEIT